MGLFSINATGLSNKPISRPTTNPMGQAKPQGSIFNNGKGPMNLHSNANFSTNDWKDGDKAFFNQRMGID